MQPTRGVVLARRGEQRAALAGELIQSLEHEVDPNAEAAWSAEIRSRLERVDAGTATTVPWSEARRRIHAAVERGASRRRDGIWP